MEQLYTRKVETVKILGTDCTKARGAFQKLWKVWAARKIGRRTKIRLLKSSVLPRPMKEN